MKIFRVLGFGLLIIVLKFLVPEIFLGIQNTLLVFFQTIDSLLRLSQSSIAHGLTL